MKNQVQYSPKVEAGEVPLGNWPKL